MFYGIVDEVEQGTQDGIAIKIGCWPWIGRCFQRGFLPRQMDSSLRCQRCHETKGFAGQSNHIGWFKFKPGSALIDPGGIEDIFNQRRQAPTFGNDELVVFLLAFGATGGTAFEGFSE